MSIIEKATTLGIDQSPVGKLLMLRIRLKNNKEDVDKLETLIRRVEEQAFYNTVDYKVPFRPAPTSLPPGEITCFRLLESGAVAPIRTSVMDKGVIVCGKTGAGKSTIMYRLLESALAQKIPIVVFTPKNDGFYEQLAQKYDVISRYLGKDGNIPNPFAQNKWDIARQFSEVFDRKDSLAVVLTALAQCPSPVTLDALLDVLPSVQLPSGGVVNPELKRSVYAVLLQLQQDALGKSLSKGDFLNLGALIAQGKSLIINTSQCSPRVEEFVVAAVMAMLRACVPAGQGVNVVVAIDEATQLVSKRGQQSSAVASEFRLARYKGVVTIVGTHTPSAVDPIIRSNCHIVFIGNLTDGGDIMAASTSCSLSREQSTVICHLPTGVAICRQASGYTKPYLVAWDPVPPGTPVDLSQPESVVNQAPAVPVVVNDPATKILKDVAAKPFLGLAARCKGIGMDWRDGKKIVEALVTDGVCTVLKFQVNQRGQPPEFLFLTDRGYQRIGVDKPTTRGGTGVAHTLIQRWVKETLAANSIEAVVEDRRNGKSVDVGLPAQNIAIEIALSTETTEPRQAQHDLESWGRVVVLCPNREVLGRVQRNFEATGMNDRRVVFSLPWDLVQTINQEV